MKLKKYSYIVVIIIIMLIGANGVNAATNLDPIIDAYFEMYNNPNNKVCYYLSPEGATKELKVVTTIFWGEKAAGRDLRAGSRVVINKFNKKLSTDSTSLLNWGSDYKDGSGKGDFLGDMGMGSDKCTTSDVCFSYYATRNEIKKMSNPSCPRYIVIEKNTTGTDEFFAWATESEILAKKAADSKTGSATYAYASNHTVVNGRTTQITESMYYNTFVVTGSGTIDKTQLKCEDIFTDDIKEMINTALQYVRVIVPILIIILGIVDLSKAVIAGKEDAMKKAQTDFIKRVLIGVAVFFVPILVNVIMDWGNIVWEGMGYTQCNFQ